MSHDEPLRSPSIVTDDAGVRAISQVLFRRGLTALPTVGGAHGGAMRREGLPHKFGGDWTLIDCGDLEQARLTEQEEL